jgi:hypothetical protein
MLSNRTSQASSAALTDEQRLALNQLPSHKDPFFAVHRAMHAIKGAHYAERTLPLQGYLVAGECGRFSESAALSLRRLFHIPREDLRVVQVCRAIHGVRGYELLERKLDQLTDGEHTILYIQNGLRFLPGGLQGDIFFDSTVLQFTENKERSERPLEYLQQRGTEGQMMAERLANRGYVKIPSGDVGKQRLGILVASYYSKEKWLDTPAPIDPLSLPDEGLAPEGFWRYYDKTLPDDPHRKQEWNWYNLFPQNTPFGQLELDHPDQTLQHDLQWHRGNI